MAEMDFEEQVHPVRQNSSGWGPFEFDLSDLLPDGLTISAVTAIAYTGKVDPKADLATQTEAAIISNVTASGAYLYLYYKYAAGIDGRCTVVFNVTLSNSGTHAFYFYGPEVSA